jgi:hypothetical protein
MLLLILVWSVLVVRNDAATPGISETGIVTSIPNNGVIEVVQDALCLPQDHWVLRGRLDISTLLENYTGLRDQVMEVLNTFGSTQDSDLTIFYRQCLTTVRRNGTCLLTNLTKRTFAI